MATKTLPYKDSKIAISGDLNDPYFKNMTLEDHANDFLSYVCSFLLGKESIVFDVGANIGLTISMLAIAASKGKIFGFEPSASCYKHLNTTVELNKFTNCKTFELALGAKSGNVRFLDNKTSGSASHLVKEGVSMGESNSNVRIKTLDQVVRELKISTLDLIKIDVEGHELDVLLGAKKSINKFKTNVFLEFNSFTLIAYGNKNPRTLLEYLMDEFAHVYRFESAKPVKIANENSMLTFIHDNLIKRGCVDDLYCSHEPI